MFDPAERLTDVEAIKSHGWFASIDWIAMESKSAVPPSRPDVDAKMKTKLRQIEEKEDLFHGQPEDTIFMNAKRQKATATVRAKTSAEKYADLKLSVDEDKNFDGYDLNANVERLNRGKMEKGGENGIS